MAHKEQLNRIKVLFHSIWMISKVSENTPSRYIRVYKSHRIHKLPRTGAELSSVPHTNKKCPPAKPEGIKRKKPHISVRLLKNKKATTYSPWVLTKYHQRGGA